MHSLSMTYELLCPECGWRVTHEAYEIAQAASQPKGFGLFQIHESSLVPPGQVYLFDQGAIGNYLSEPIISQEFLKKFMDELFNIYAPKEKPFDYRERAAIEFDINNDSGLR